MRRTPRLRKAGMPNLLRHVDNIQSVYGLPCVVAINRFPSGYGGRALRPHREGVREARRRERPPFRGLGQVGGEGALELADEVMRLIEQPSELPFRS